MNLHDLELSQQELEAKGDWGKIAWKLIKAEGRATWIPDFVNWLLENYIVKHK